MPVSHEEEHDSLEPPRQVSDREERVRNRLAIHLAGMGIGHDNPHTEKYDDTYRMSVEDLTTLHNNLHAEKQEGEDT